jgi:hypothetical protein
MSNPVTIAPAALNAATSALPIPPSHPVMTTRFPKSKSDEKPEKCAIWFSSKKVLTLTGEVAG